VRENCQFLRSQRLCRIPLSSARAYLELGVAVVDEDVGGLELGDVAVTLELLPHLGANGGDGDVEGVHGLDLGGLSSRLALVWQSWPLALILSVLNSSVLQLFLFRSSQIRGNRTARSQSR
jgi:hypothetical protein